jgi:putative flippase GtrA
VSRGARFVWVGAGGFMVQAAVLQGLVGLAAVPYPLATALAVEAAILHNFLWHERWTWADRPARTARLTRLLRFNGGTALVSIGGNVALMSLLVGGLQLPLLAAMAIAVAVVSLVNFTCADRFVFTA